MVTTLVGVAQISMANGMWLNCSVKGSVCGLIQYGISRYSVLASFLDEYAVHLAIFSDLLQQKKKTSNLVCYLSQMRYTD